MGKEGCGVKALPTGPDLRISNKHDIGDGRTNIFNTLPTRGTRERFVSVSVWKASMIFVLGKLSTPLLTSRLYGAMIRLEMSCGRRDKC